MDIRLALLTGADIPIPECQLIMHQPTISEIAFMGEREFFTALQTITLHKSMFVDKDKAVLDDITNFQIFMTIVNGKETVDKKNLVMSLFLLTFPKYKVLLTPRSILFSDESGSHIIDANNFEFFQQVFREVFCVNSSDMDKQAFNPANEQAREIAEKLMRGRQRVAAQNGDQNASIFSQYLSSLSIGLKLSLLELKKYTMFQIFDSMERYSLYTNWDIDLRVRLAGGKPDSQPDNWMQNIH
jgi:hypothetical protein